MLRRLPLAKAAQNCSHLFTRREASTVSHLTSENLTAKKAQEIHLHRNKTEKIKVKKNTVLFVKRGSVELGTGNFGKVTKKVSYDKKVTTEITDTGDFIATENGPGIATMEFWNEGHGNRCHYDPAKDISVNKEKSIV